MPEVTFSTFKQFRRKVKARNEELEEALKEYFANGGIIRVQINSSKEWPKLIYPSERRLKYLIDKKREQRAELLRQKSQWQKRLQNAKLYHVVHFFKKYAEPVYWKHVAKLIIDSDYRHDATKVKLPAHLAGDERWKPMIKMFVENPEYRKQLCITFEESPIYRKNKKLARYSDQLLEFRKQESTRKIKELDAKIDALEKEVAILKKLLRWSRA
ncbi:MAG: hypothetical protein J7L44_04450 [Candidatus Diapherotrites archaeon]|nr:hypothetical protein [Candidatus Diapherotrites archaeon]